MAMTKTRALKKTKQWVISLLRAGILIEIGFIVLYPVLYMISVAFRPVAEMYNPNVVWIPLSLTMENITQAWQYMEFP